MLRYLAGRKVTQNDDRRAAPGQSGGDDYCNYGTAVQAALQTVLRRTGHRMPVNAAQIRPGARLYRDGPWV